MDEVPQGVGRTALATAWMRAEASRQPDRLFDDWLAQTFVDAAPGAVPFVSPALLDELGPLAETVTTYMLVRTRFFDDELTAAAAAGCRQLVLLAAGLDSRAFRLPWPDDTILFEVDRDDMLTFKERVLATTAARPRCERRPVIADLTEDWADRLLAAGFDPTRPAAWLAEGILAYLSATEAERLLAGITDLSAPASRFALEDARGLSRALLDRSTLGPPMGEFAGLWKGGLEGETAAWLGDHGWLGRESDFRRVAAGLGRTVAGPMPIEASFVTVRRVAHQKEAGVTRTGVPAAAVADLAGHGARRR
ncbi:N-methyltransferase [Frankia sp. EI5c]|uniref:SAM-dependent methyltransferase n=1 Tax=Frankia sp. EI5c TaxID=683316 RepID=UPI0007C3AA57|nr:SAM-dependent methyltransferase [Frankia sp. EI5c]OAA28554.1 N-methyltransferase [Frankia sp. EI5c]